MTIGLFDFVPLRGDPTKLPDFEYPHYIVAREGVYLRKKTLLGEVFLKQKDMPNHVSKMDKYSGGLLLRDESIRIPAPIMAQALDFFRKVYAEHKAEAEVLILYNRQTGKYRLMPPYQYVTGASVESIYDPRDIVDGFVEIGTIHSHCMMDAFHSSTDTGDASGFNGVHLTIGKVMDPNPDYAAMIMINGVQWNFSIEKIADLTPSKSRSPKVWMEYLGSPREIHTKLKAKGFDGVDKWFDDITRPRWSDKSIVTYKPYSPIPTGKPTGWKPSQYKSKGPDERPYGKESVKLSRELQDWVPADWLSASGNFMLRSDKFEQAFIDKLKRLRKAAADRGYELWFDLIDSDNSPESLEAMWEYWDSDNSQYVNEDALMGASGTMYRRRGLEDSVGE